MYGNNTNLCVKVIFIQYSDEGLCNIMPVVTEASILDMWIYQARFS